MSRLLHSVRPFLKRSKTTRNSSISSATSSSTASKHTGTSTADPSASIGKSAACPGDGGAKLAEHRPADSSSSASTSSSTQLVDHPDSQRTGSDYLSPCSSASDSSSDARGSASSASSRSPSTNSEVSQQAEANKPSSTASAADGDAPPVTPPTETPSSAPLLVVQQASPPTSPPPADVSSNPISNTIRELRPTSTAPALTTHSSSDLSPVPHDRARAQSDGVSTNLSPRSPASPTSTAEQSSRSTPSPSSSSVAHAPTVPRSSARMTTRKIWVKRPGASPTLVQIKEDDLVDDVRDMILRKYANSLGRSFDAPDMTLRIVSRPDQANVRLEQILGPDEEMWPTIDRFYPGGQKMEEALVIDVPPKRTPRPSPRAVQHHHSYHQLEDYRPQETGSDYFPVMPDRGVSGSTLGLPPTHQHTASNGEHVRSMTVVNTGQIPPLPSPGSVVRRRPKTVRTHTASPILPTHVPLNGSNAGASSAALTSQHRPTGRTRADSSASDITRSHANGAPQAPPLPTSPGPSVITTNIVTSQPPTPGSGGRVQRPRTTRKSTPKINRNRSLPGTDGFSAANMLPSISSMLDNSVPPINVLVVEDNAMNLRIMEKTMGRLRVRWQTAVNGKIAVDKWRKGGFHLVLMDIQMPVMNGLQATKEIRRLERVNGIGVFSSSVPATPDETTGQENRIEETEPQRHDPEADKLPVGEGLFKSPIIIVALTASSLQSDRHEALAAGCNDFLTKPVKYEYLEVKVREWGCMQALIDFDGWRKWRDYDAPPDAGKKNGVTAQKDKTAKKSAAIEKLKQSEDNYDSATSGPPTDGEAKSSGNNTS